MRLRPRLCLLLALSLALIAAPVAPGPAAQPVRDGARSLAELERDLKDPAPGTRLRAVAALALLGAPAAPSLVRALEDGSVDVHTRRVVALSLASIIPATDETIAALIRSLGDIDTAVQDNATWVLRKLGPRALAAITSAMSDQDLRIRHSAAGIVATSLALGQMGPVPGETLSALIGALSDHDPDVRATAARALGDAGSAAKPAVAGLQKLAASDPVDYVRSVATHALDKIGRP